MQKLVPTAAAVFAAITLCGAQSTAAQTAQYKRDVPDSLAKAATVTEAVATAAAQKRVPKGTIQAMELERENGHLLYSYDFKTTGKSGIDEVNVDANTGKVLHVGHESPVTEKKEAAADAKEAKAKMKSAPHTP
ncbi:MAG: PepSY domain-containing protein [Gemmatimonadaceae bacterium]|nr:PepSY domain-containing protein [Gemmatimonadaceae bacterium]